MPARPLAFPPSRPRSLSRPIITIITDYGVADHFLGVMKGVILSINPNAELVDLSSEGRAYDILGGAFTLSECARYFPPGTVHLVVVDPGVGSARRPILAVTPSARFVAPDNGVLSLASERGPGAPATPNTSAAAAMEVRHITADRYFLKPLSNTFHGRDIFAPVAAWLSLGVAPEEFGEVITDYVRLAWPKPKRLARNRWRGVVVRIDRFGNVMTNFNNKLAGSSRRSFTLAIAGHKVTRWVKNFSEAQPSELVALIGSSGYLEIAANRASAAAILGVEPGAKVEINLG